MPNCKFSGHEDLTKELYEYFWKELKTYFINSLRQSKIDNHFPISQRQAIVKLLVENNRGKIFVKN